MTGRCLAGLVIASAALWCGCAQGLSGTPVGVTGHSADIRGTVVSDTGGQVEYWVQYGPTAAYGSETEHALVETQKNQGTSFEPGIIVIGSGNQLLRNRVVGANTGGIVIQSGEGNVVAENEVIDGLAEDWQDPQDRLGDGIFVGPQALATLLRANVATNNDGDGIEAQSTTTRLRDNRATGNGDFGIDAAAGATDLGGNTASGNGNPLQCRNVFCS